MSEPCGKTRLFKKPADFVKPLPRSMEAMPMQFFRLFWKNNHYRKGQGFATPRVHQYTLSNPSLQGMRRKKRRVP